MQIELVLLIFCLLYVWYQFWLFGLFLKTTYRKMAELKIGFYLLQASGYAIWFWSFFSNWGDVKSGVLFIFAVAFSVYKVLNVHLDYSKKKIEFDDFKRDAKEKRKHHSDDIEVKKKL